MARSGVWGVCEDSKAARRGLIVGGGSSRRFGVQHWKSPSRLFPNTDNDVTRCLECLEQAWRRLQQRVRMLTLPVRREKEKNMLQQSCLVCVRANISHIIPNERTDDEHATCLPRAEQAEAMGELVACTHQSCKQHAHVALFARTGRVPSSLAVPLYCPRLTPSCAYLDGYA